MQADEVVRIRALVANLNVTLCEQRAGWDVRLYPVKCHAHVTSSACTHQQPWPTTIVHISKINLPSSNKMLLMCKDTLAGSCQSIAGVSARFPEMCIDITTMLYIGQVNCMTDMLCT
jgi:hypothetical protein